MARRSSRGRGPGAGGSVTLVSRPALCVLGGISERRLLLWEHEELIGPAVVRQTHGRSETLYDASALKRIRLIRILADELDVNLPGIDVILHLLEQMAH